MVYGGGVAGSFLARAGLRAANAYLLAYRLVLHHHPRALPHRRPHTGGTFTGDVVEIGYLDTTLWEFHGDYLSNDLPSGRLIRFPNTLVLQTQVYNYSWRKFPFIWNEVPFHIAYESDLAYVEETIKAVAKRELGPDMAEHIKDFKELLKETPVDELDIREYPFVVFRTNANTWLEVSVTYLVAPKSASVTRSRLIRAIVSALLEQPDRVLFPKSNAR